MLKQTTKSVIRNIEVRNRIKYPPIHRFGPEAEVEARNGPMLALDLISA
jgi:hypothetical protein